MDQFKDLLAWLPKESRDSITSEKEACEAIHDYIINLNFALTTAIWDHAVPKNKSIKDRSEMVREYVRELMGGSGV